MARQAHNDLMQRLAIYLDKEDDAQWKANLHSPKSFLKLVTRVMRTRLRHYGDTPYTRSLIQAEVRRMEFLIQRFKHAIQSIATQQNRPVDNVYTDIHLAAQELFPVNPRRLDYCVVYNSANQPVLRLRKKRRQSSVHTETSG